MQIKSNLIRIQRKTVIYFLIVILTLGIATPVLADYLGPNRTVTETTGVCKMVLYEYQHVAAKNEDRWRKVDTWSCGDESKAWLAYPSEPSSSPTLGDQYWSTEESVASTTVTYPPATISAALQNCNLNNGWCITPSSLSLSGIEPIAGQSILAIEGSLNGQTFACSGASCNIPLNEGNNSFTYWALSSWGDSSTMGTLTAKVDSQLPTITGAFNGTTGSNGWYLSPVSFNGSASDSTSGLASFTCTLDGVSLGSCASITVNSEGIHTVVLTARDNAGNTRTLNQNTSVDTQNPVLNASLSGTLGSNNWRTAAQLNAFASDATPGSGLSAFEYNLDNSSWTAFPASGILTLPEGKHSVDLRAVDKAGRAVSSSKSFWLDSVTPNVILNPSGMLGANNWYITSLNLTASASDATSGLDVFEYSLDNNAWTTYTAPLTISDGKHSLSFWAQDTAGLVTQVDRTYLVDTHAPQIVGSVSGVPGTNGWYTSDVTLTASASDPMPGSGLDAFTYILNNSAEAPYTNPLTLSDGQHTIQLSAQDKAGLPYSIQRTVKVDTIHPSLSINTTLPNWIKDSVTLNGTANDSGSGLSKVEISFDGGQTWQAVSGMTSWNYPWHTPDSSNGIHNVHVRAIDAAGLTIEQTFNVGVDNQAPKISLPDSWYQWDMVTLDIWDNHSSLSETRIEINDPEGRWPARVIQLDSERFPLDFKWDRRFGDGTIAPLGTYNVKVIAFDNLGNMARQSASINILLGILPAGPASTLQPYVRVDSTPSPIITAAAPISSSLITTQSTMVSAFGSTPDPIVQTTSAPETIPTPRSAPTQTSVLDWLESIFVPNANKESVSEIQALDESKKTPQPSADNSNVLWGATAAAVIGAATAYALDEKRKRKAEEARQAAQVQAEADAKNAATQASLQARIEAKKVQGWLEGQAILNAQIEQAKALGATDEEIAALKKEGAEKGFGVALGSASNLNQNLYNTILMQERNVRMEAKMERIEAKEDRQWAEAQQKKAEHAEQAQRARDADTARWEGLASQGQYAANVPSQEKTWWEKYIAEPAQKILNPKTITGVILTAALGSTAIMARNVLNNPHVFDEARAHAESLTEEYRTKYPHDSSKLALSYLFSHPYDAVSKGMDVLDRLTSIGASYAEAVWQQNPLLHAQLKSLESLEDSVCTGVSNQAWSNRCTAAFYLPAGLIAKPFDTTLGVANGLVIDPVSGFVKQAALAVQNVEALPSFVSVIKDEGFQGAKDFLAGLTKKNLKILLDDKQVQSALFFEGLILLTSVAAPVAGGIILGMTAKGLIDIDTAVTISKNKKSLIEFIASHNVRTTVVSSVLVLALITTGLGKQASEFRTFQDGLSPSAQTPFQSLSLLEQTRLADLALKMKLPPGALEFYLTESANPGSPLADLPLTDALRASALAETYGESTMSMILRLCEKSGSNPYEILLRSSLAEGQSPTGLALGIENSKNPVNHSLVNLNLTDAELNNILIKSIKNPDSKVVVLGYGGGVTKPYYILGDEINGSYLSLSSESWAPFENARANFFQDINAPFVETAIENRKIFLFNVEYKLILDPVNVERFSLPELRLIELEKNNYVQVPVGEYTALVPIELLDTYEQYLPATLFNQEIKP